jgi:hypothetical protein
MKELEEKGTLKKVNEGIVFTIDERPKIGDWYLSSYNLIGKRSGYFINCLYDRLYNSDHKIIASTFGVGLELWMNDTCNEYQIINKIKFPEGFLNIEIPYVIEDNILIVKPILDTAKN